MALSLSGPVQGVQGVKKKRNYWLLDAHQRTQQESLDWRSAYGALDALKADAAQYNAEVHDEVIILQNEASGRLIKIPYTTRFSDAYAGKQRAKLQKAAVALRLTGQKIFFWTLTLDPKKFSSAYDMWTGISSMWNKFMTLIRKQHPTVSYIKMFETTQEGILHIHFVVNAYLDVNFVRAFWTAYGGGFEMHVSPVWDNIPLDRYLMKYLRKTLNDTEDFEVNITKVLLWALYARQFSISRNLETAILDKAHEQFKQNRPIFFSDLEKEGPNGPLHALLAEKSARWVYLGHVPKSVAEKTDAEILQYLADMATYRSKPVKSRREPVGTSLALFKTL